MPRFVPRERDEEMKLKCKKCEQKCKLNKLSELVCTDNHCELKYNMRGETLQFKDFKLTGEEPEYISNYTTPEPPKVVEMTQEEWMQICNYGDCG